MTNSQPITYYLGMSKVECFSPSQRRLLEELEAVGHRTSSVGENKYVGLSTYHFNGCSILQNGSDFTVVSEDRGTMLSSAKMLGLELYAVECVHKPVRVHA